MKLMSTQDRLTVAACIAIWAPFEFYFESRVQWGVLPELAVSLVGSTGLVIAVVILWLRLRLGAIPVGNKSLARELHQVLNERRGENLLSQRHVYYVEDRKRSNVLAMVARFDADDLIDDGQDPGPVVGDAICVSGRWAIVHKLTSHIDLSAPKGNGAVEMKVNPIGPGPKVARTGVTVMSEGEIRELLDDLREARRDSERGQPGE